MYTYSSITPFKNVVYTSIWYKGQPKQDAKDMTEWEEAQAGNQ
jgi:hypothetical protein